MKYPVTIVDDFFADPDAVRELALSHTFDKNDDNYPGKRTERLNIIEPFFYENFVKRLNSIFGFTDNNFCDCGFQRNKCLYPKTDPRNRGWVHVDTYYSFQGIVYLNPDPDPETGTDIYKCIGVTSYSSDEKEKVRRETYQGKTDLITFKQVYEEYHKQYKRTVSVDNVYNRLVCFDNTTHHGVRYNGDTERLTLPFFVQNNNPAPLERQLI